MPKEMKEKAKLNVGGFDYKDFLTGFLNASENLSVAMPLFAEGVDDMQAGLKKFQEGGRVLFGQSEAPAPLMLAKPNITSEVEDLERQVCAKVKDHISKKMNIRGHAAKRLRALGDGQLIALFRQLFAFVQENPQLIQFFINLFTKLPTPSTQV